MFQCGVSGQDRVVRLDDRSGYLKSSGKGMVTSVNNKNSGNVLLTDVFSKFTDFLLVTDVCQQHFSRIFAINRRLSAATPL